MTSKIFKKHISERPPYLFCLFVASQRPSAGRVSLGMCFEAIATWSDDVIPRTEHELPGIHHIASYPVLPSRALAGHVLVNGYSRLSLMKIDTVLLIVVLRSMMQ